MSRCFVTLGRGLEARGSIEAVMHLQKLVLTHGKATPLQPLTNLPGEDCSIVIGKYKGQPLEIFGSYDAIVRTRDLWEAGRRAAIAH